MFPLLHFFFFFMSLGHFFVSCGLILVHMTVINEQLTSSFLKFSHISSSSFCYYFFPFSFILNFQETLEMRIIYLISTVLLIYTNATVLRTKGLISLLRCSVNECIYFLESIQNKVTYDKYGFQPLCISCTGLISVARLVIFICKVIS